MTERQFTSILEERDFYKEQYERLCRHLAVARPVVRAADQCLRCIAKFRVDAYCAEPIEALDKVLMDYAAYEVREARQGEGE